MRVMVYGCARDCGVNEQPAAEILVFVYTNNNARRCGYLRVRSLAGCARP